MLYWDYVGIVFPYSVLRPSKLKLRGQKVEDLKLESWDWQNFETLDL